MVKLVCLITALLVGGSAASTSGPAGDDHATEARFSDFAASIYRGPVAYPKFAGAQRPYRDFRTRIRESVAAGPAFAGHYAIAVIGCGTDCRFGFMTDLRTGLVRDLPLGGEENYQLLYRLRPNSRLLETQWMRLDDKSEPLGCALEDFVWTGQVFKSLGRRNLRGDCPEWRDFAD